MTPKPTKTDLAPKTVGAELKAARLSQDKSLKDVELATRVRGKYLLAIESGNHRELPHNVYAKGFIQSYADYLGLDAKVFSERYVAERGDQHVQLRRQSQLTTSKFILTPRLLTSASVGAVALVVGVYLVFQLRSITAPPNLTITNPSKDQVLYGSLINMSGKVAGGADVYVNNSPILVDDSGSFTDPIALQEGVNSIEITAKNRLGKTTTVTRNILAHVPKVDPASLLPGAPYDGVAISVQVRSHAATVTLKADGKQVFQGTMLPGTTQTFKASSSLVLATSDGGSTYVTVTNQSVANKDLGAIGKTGEAKSNFEFAKDTQFQ